MPDPAPKAAPAAAQSEETVNVTLFDMAYMGPGFGGYGMMPGVMPPLAPMTPPGGIVAFPGMPAGPLPGGGGFLGAVPGTMSIQVDRNVVKAGPIKINVVNGSHGLPHNLVVTPVDSAETWLPFDYMLWVRKSDIAGETGPLKPGQTKTLTLTLPAGDYLLASSVGSDFAAGMKARLKVTQ